MNKRFVLGIIFLLAQVLSIVYARFIPERFFCWAPFDQHTYYEIVIKINKKELSNQEVTKRYHYKAFGWEPRSIHNVFNIINQYETTYGKKDSAIVEVKYSINGNQQEVWQLKK